MIPPCVALGLSTLSISLDGVLSICVSKTHCIFVSMHHFQDFCSTIYWMRQAIASHCITFAGAHPRLRTLAQQIVTVRHANAYLKVVSIVYFSGGYDVVLQGYLDHVAVRSVRSSEGSHGLWDLNATIKPSRSAPQRKMPRKPSLQGCVVHNECRSGLSADPSRESSRAHDLYAETVYSSRQTRGLCTHSTPHEYNGYIFQHDPYMGGIPTRKITGRKGNQSNVRKGGGRKSDQKFHCPVI